MDTRSMCSSPAILVRGEEREAKGKSSADFDVAPFSACTLQDGAVVHIGENSPAITAVHKPPIIPCSSMRSEDSGGQREGFLPKPPAPRYNPKGMRIRGAALMMPNSRVSPNSINKGKTKVVPNVVDVHEKAGTSRSIKRELQRDTNPRVRVKYFLEQFEKSRRSYADKGKIRPDLKAQRDLKTFRNLVNGPNAIYGEVPGVEVGDQYHYLAEVFLISLHRRARGGIDFIPESKSTFRDTAGNPISVAVSVVISPNAYDGDEECGDTIWYTGEGGNNDNSNNELPPADQKLVRGNLALKHSYDKHLSVRVIRGFKVTKNEVIQSRSDRIYCYLGFYDVQEYRKEIGSTGVQVYRFKLVKK